MALNLRLFTGEAFEVGDEVDLLVFIPIFKSMFSMSTRTAPAGFTSVTVPKK